MTETAPQAPGKPDRTIWHVDIHLSYEMGALSPAHIRLDVGKGVGQDGAMKWEHQGIASFDAPCLVIPRAGAPIVQYFLYHIEEVKAWLTEEYVRRFYNEVDEVIGPEVGITDPPPGAKPVYAP